MRPYAQQVAAARATGKVVVFMGDRLNRCAQLKPAMYLRGVEQILLDLVEQARDRRVHLPAPDGLLRGICPADL